MQLFLETPNKRRPKKEDKVKGIFGGSKDKP
jgi:hypothetical protein